MFSDELRRYMRNVILWTTFWVIVGIGGLSGWSFAIFEMAWSFMPGDGMEHLPLFIIWLAGSLIFAITYILTLSRWIETDWDELYHGQQKPAAPRRNLTLIP